MANPPFGNNDTVIAFEPYSEVRQLIGNEVKLNEIFTEDRIQACAKLISVARNAFFDITSSEMNMLERLAAAPHVNEDETANFIAGIAAHANNIKGQAEMLGFTLITRICTHLAKACHTSNQSYAVKRLLIIKMAETLRQAYKLKITDDGGPVGKEIMLQLDRILLSEASSV